MGGLLLAIRACRLGWLFLRPRRMYEEPKADRILRSSSDLRELSERSDEGAKRALSRAAGTDSPGSAMAPQGAEGDMTARSSPPMCGFAAHPLCQRRWHAGDKGAARHGLRVKPAMTHSNGRTAMTHSNGSYRNDGLCYAALDPASGRIKSGMTHQIPLPNGILAPLERHWRSWPPHSNSPKTTPC